MLKAVATMVFGVAVIVNGVLRGSAAAIGFGVVAGAIALAASVLMFKEHRFQGFILALASALLVGGWFAKTLATEPYQHRYLVMAVLSVLEMAVLFWRGKARA
jgi:hypothetical protein